jgi:hypothetical protein
MFFFDLFLKFYVVFVFLLFLYKKNIMVKQPPSLGSKQYVQGINKQNWYGTHRKIRISELSKNHEFKCLT